MFSISREAYEEFRDYIDAQPDSAFRPKPGDHKPHRRARALSRSKGTSDSRADRARNLELFKKGKIARIRHIRAAWKAEAASPAIH